MITAPDQYSELIEEANNNNNNISHFLERNLQHRPLNIQLTMMQLFLDGLTRMKQFISQKSVLPLKKIDNLRYGENPHQKAGVSLFRK